MQLPEILTRLSSIGQIGEIPLDLCVDHILFTDMRLAQVQKDIKSYLMFSTFYRLMHSQQPTVSVQVPRIASKYCNER